MLYNKRPTVSITPKGERLRAFPLRSGRKQRCPRLTLLFNTALEILSKAIREEK